MVADGRWPGTALGRQIEWLGNLVQAKRPVRLPVVLGRDEVRDLLAHVHRKLAPHADDISSGVDETVTFRDCGGSFERVACPRCHREIEIGTWQEWMDEDYSEKGGFRLGLFTAPCCAAELRLSDLLYEEPQGYSRYHLTASNVGRRLSAASIAKLGEVLGCKLRVIRQQP